MILYPHVYSYCLLSFTFVINRPFTSAVVHVDWLHAGELTHRS